MTSVKQNPTSPRDNKHKNIFARLIDWIADGAARAQKGGGCVN